jgi:erythromycin esterase-like protein
MSTSLPSASSIHRGIRSLATPLTTTADLEPLVDATGDRRLVCIGEASHGTHEFYRWRGELSRRLIEEHGFSWIGVEGDWPDCWRINRWLRGIADQELDACGVLAGFERWPTWMWANRDVADFLDWLHRWNLERPGDHRVGFYGLDVYSLWDSLRVIMTWLREHHPDALDAATEAWQCFLPYGEDPHRYARRTRLVPESCEPEVVALLVEVVRRGERLSHDGDDAFDAVQNAAIAVEAERYYRVMVRGNRESWNIRDRHMADTISRLDAHHGPHAKGLVWEHNTHIGDARATDMARAGMVNVGQLVRDRFGVADVALVGFASHRGTVLAARAWGEPELVMPVPAAHVGSHEDLLHRVLGEPAVLVFGPRRDSVWLSSRLGHRAIGVVYDPTREAGNYVPTVMGDRYDALIWLEQTQALTPLHHEQAPHEPELETEPTGF